MAYLASIGVERLLELDDEGVVELLHDHELSVLVPLILEDLLDGHYFAGFLPVRLMITVPGRRLRMTRFQ